MAIDMGRVDYHVSLHKTALNSMSRNKGFDYIFGTTFLEEQKNELRKHLTRNK